MTSTSAPRLGGKIHLAAWLLLLQGGLMEFGTFLGFIVLVTAGVSQADVSTHFSFIVPFFNEHLFLMMVMSGVFGALRTIGAIGLWKNRMWGYTLSIINCVVTLVLMLFMLPAGIVDGLLSGGGLVLLLMARYGNAPIEQRGRA